MWYEIGLAGTLMGPVEADMGQVGTKWAKWGFLRVKYWVSDLISLPDNLLKHATMNSPKKTHIRLPLAKKIEMLDMAKQGKPSELANVPTQWTRTFQT